MAHSEIIREVYERGELLADAALAYALDNQIKAHRWAQKYQRAKAAVVILVQVPTLRSPSIPQSTKKHIADGHNIDLNSLSTDPFYLRDVSKYQRTLRSYRLHPEDHVEMMRRFLLTRLFTSEFIAIGYELPRRSADGPRRISPDVVQQHPHVDWAQSTISGNGLMYAAVRIVPTEWLPTEVDDIPSRGRKSRRAEIVTAFDDLVVRGEINLTHTDKEIGNAVRTALFGAPLAQRGLSDDTIRRHTKGRLR